eukprot:11689067-Alexandrium_andersonii.AAC.1
MSASLVGSEMCIRDSLRGRPNLVGGSLAEVCGAPAARAVATLQDSSPVSYTHLTLPTICSV